MNERNRRYVKLQTLKKQGYFDLEKIRRRDAAVYEHYIGKYQKATDKNFTSLTDIVLNVTDVREGCSDNFEDIDIRVLKEKNCHFGEMEDDVDTMQENYKLMVDYLEERIISGKDDIQEDDDVDHFDYIEDQDMIDDYFEENPKLSDKKTCYERFARKPDDVNESEIDY
ncbi:hypothetical protein O9G_002239 [Rozella allomycis CSF55]|uniref:CCD97-like C-terminal domain-containing protein n=1 Tax=Rozella allomycis (strain CSF55) TaxID=988480 RepID=A0A075B1E3_ROZAC|nr:hypothetical protein O9G_002239 [Rozella allomycis CSF55]|eukprot:EPZ36173.1 hypothetical protein O9G_002239 [Rozella allomycis CSF55]